MRDLKLREAGAPLLFPELAEPASSASVPPDAAARAEALDIRRSFVVEAPAGSGKTGLLIQRYLKLLTDEAVGAPEQVLAITFTNKAAGEMRDRVLARLRDAGDGEEPVGSEFDRVTRELAGAVLARDRALGWGLLEQPHRINLRTIDSICAEIARSLPVLSGAGGSLAPVEDAGPLYREAARRTVLLLGAEDTEPGFDAALRDLLLHRDANLPDCERLIAEMLGVRDQWGMLVPLDGRALEDAVLDGEVLPRLQRALEQAICAELAGIARDFPAPLLAEAADLAGYFGRAAGYQGEASPLACCAGVHGMPVAAATDRDRWVALKQMLTTKQGDWRKPGGLNGKNLGFEYTRSHALHGRLSALLEAMQSDDELLRLVCALGDLPPGVYPEAQWRVAKSLFRVLRRALVELQMVFAARGQCDFTELSLLARSALETNGGREDLGSAMGARLEHLLVDEMQDTSSGQYELIERLTATWDGHSQTVFLVGDPRQSIYLFRQARVERLVETLRTGRLGDLPLTRLRLTANFRSQRTLVEDLNRDLELVFAARPGEAMPLRFQAADAVLPPAAEADGLRWHANPVRTHGRVSPAQAAEDGAPPETMRTDSTLRSQQARRNARAIRRIAADWLGRPLPAGRREPWRIAVLVRTRRHLAEVVTALRDDTGGAPVPYRAVEIEPLAERQEILDLTAITRVLLHPADRAAGFALLRGPWCGLSLADLHLLAGADDAGLARHSVQRLIEERGHLLSEAACGRMRRVWSVLDGAGRQRGRAALAVRVEGAWRSLGGDAALSEDQLANARRYFELLDETAAAAALTGAPMDIGVLEERLQRLYAEPRTLPPGTGFVELLTMHRAKGLEWDVVLIPALERGQGIMRGRLLTWAELEAPDSSREDTSPVMLAPIAGRGEQMDALTRWLRRLHAAQEAAERKRLFYVAATRARQELHLFASPDLTPQGAVRTMWDSLLSSAMAAAEPHLSRHIGAAGAAGPPGGWRQAAAHPGTLDLAAAGVYEMPGGGAEGVRPAGAAGMSAERGRRSDAAEEELYPAPVRPAIERLPASFDPGARFEAARAQRISAAATLGTGTARVGSRAGAEPYVRPEGTFVARGFGTVVHGLLELAADRLKTISRDQLLAEIAGWTTRIEALLRAEGAGPAEVGRLTREARQAITSALRDRDGAWLLAPHPGGATEVALTTRTERADSIRREAVRSIRIDRMFRAGAEPHATGEDYLWIVDYKTAAHSGSDRRAWLEAQRELYAGQLELYAAGLAAVYEVAADRIRVALYHPLLPQLTWWKLPVGGGAGLTAALDERVPVS